ncbi:MAG: hypothetical protein ACRDJP_05400 [Actinomycetota bacterium]
MPTAKNEELTSLARVLVHVLARGPVAEDYIRGVVAPRGTERRWIQAYNLCDGTRTDAQIAEAVGLDQDALGRAIDRWQSVGIIFPIQSNGATQMLHLYPIQVRVT